MKIKKSLMYDLQSMTTLVDLLYAMQHDVQIYTFTGPLGAGKTTLVQQLLARFGITEPITSPTFNYVNAYQMSGNQIFYHFDLYRLTSLDEFLMNGFDELLYQKHSWAFIEWPEIIKPLLTKRVCNVTIDYESDDQRIVTYEL